MKPVNSSDHADYHKRVLTELRKYYSDAVDSFSSFTWQNHLHAILSSFTDGETSDMGTFYDFHSRLCLLDKNNF